MEFLTYQRFNDKEGATQLADLLKKSGIEYRIEDNSLSFDPTFAYNEHDKDFRVQLKKIDFEVADRIQYELLNSSIDSIDKSYYLFEFTDQELIEVITKSDEWSKFDFLLAQKILKERGKEINSGLVDTLRNQRIEELAKPEQGHRVWIFAGFLFALMGGVLGILIGFHIMTHKKTLPNGDRVYGFDENARNQAKWIFILGIAFFIFWTLSNINLQS